MWDLSLPLAPRLVASGDTRVYGGNDNVKMDFRRGALSASGSLVSAAEGWSGLVLWRVEEVGSGGATPTRTPLPTSTPDPQPYRVILPTALRLR